MDVAMKYRVPCGGWCPEDRSDENGTIPDRYPMTPLKKGGPHERTARNVRDSDGTIVIYFHELSGGTAYTVGCCIEQRVPHRLIDAAKYSPEDAVPLMGAFVRDHDVDILNIAGPRASEWAGGYDYAFRAIDVLLSRMKSSGRRRR
jgi:hypothetical protein